MAKIIDNYNVEEEVTLNQPQKAFDYENGEVILRVKHLRQYFRFGRGKFKYTKAVHDVSFDVYKGEVFGLVGESGCGKTTTGRSIIKLYHITSGDVYFKGVRIAAGTRWNEKEIKFTKIRLERTLQDLDRQEKDELNPLKSDYEKRLKEYHEELEKTKFGIQEQYPTTNDASDEDNVEAKKVELNKANLSNKEKVDALKAEYQANVKAVKDKYAQMREEKISKAQEIINFEKDRIKKARRDDKEAKYKSITRSMQMIFQDPIASLNPRMTIRNIIAEGLIIRGVKDKAFIDNEVKRVLELVGLLPEHANRYPHEFSGGQRQRIGIARAIIMNPELIIADEPVSALDVSIQAQVINLLNDLRNELGLTILFIAHNLSVVKYFCDRIAVMYYGELMEVAKSEELFAHPLHPYTKSLLSAVPHPDPNVEHGRTRIVYRPQVDHDYTKQKPTLREITPGHFVRCNDEEMEKYLKELQK